MNPGVGQSPCHSLSFSTQQAPRVEDVLEVLTLQTEPSRLPWCPLLIQHREFSLSTHPFGFPSFPTSIPVAGAAQPCPGPGSSSSSQHWMCCTPGCVCPAEICYSMPSSPLWTRFSLSWALLLHFRPWQKLKGILFNYSTL